MRFPESRRALGPVVISCLLATAGVAQEPVTGEEDPEFDRLVDELWDAEESQDALTEDAAGDVLELSLEAARAIGLTNDLQLQGVREVVDAAHYRELGSWGAFEWLFTATGTLAESEVEEDFFGEQEVDTSSEDLSFGFERAFASGGNLSLAYSHTYTRTNHALIQNKTPNRDVLSAIYTRPLMRGSGPDYTTSMQKVAELRWRREREAYRLARQEFLVQIDGFYWDLVLAGQQVSVAGSALDLALEQLDRDRRRREAGVATEVEVIQDEATVARRVEGVLLAQTTLRSGMDRLRSTLFPGVDSETWAVSIKAITPFPDVRESPTIGAWKDEISATLGLRGEVRISELDVEIAELLHERALSEKRPSLDLLFQLSSQGYDAKLRPSMEEAFSYEFPSVSAGLNFELPMQNTALDNEERAARAELRGARLGLDAQRSLVALELRDALRQVAYQVEATTAAGKSLEAAERLMEAERARYEQGLATNFQVLEFQQALVEAQYAEHEARAAYGKALAALSGARGLSGRRSGAEAP